MSNSKKATLGFFAIVWCSFWWGYGFGKHSTHEDEIQSLQSRLTMARALVHERPADQSDAQTLMRLEENRLATLMGIAQSSAIYLALAPILAPYEAYELHRLRSASRALQSELGK